MSVAATKRKLQKAGRAGINFIPVVVFRQLHDPPILIGGCARSGTTLVQSILSSNPRIFAFPRETGLFCPTGYWRRIPHDLNAPFSMHKFYRHMLVQKIPRGARRWCEKTPKNVLFFGRIIDHFGGRVRLIHVVRDGRDVVTSRHPRNPSSYWVGPRRWVEEVRAGLAWEGHECVLTVRYEDVVRDLESQLARFETFLEEDFRGLADVWHERAALRMSVAWFDEVRTAHSGSIGRWKDPRHRAVVEQLMAMPEAVELLERFGYDTAPMELPGGPEGEASSERDFTLA